MNKDDDIIFFGDVLFRNKHGDKNHLERRNFELDALDIVDQNPLWSLNFPKQGPFLSGSPSSGKLVFVWNAGTAGLHDELARDPKLQALWDKEKPKGSDYLLEILEGRNGKLAGAVVLHTGNHSYIPETIKAIGDWLVMEDDTFSVPIEISAA